MEDLLTKVKDQPSLPKIGDLIEGKIIEIGTRTIYLDLGPLGAGVIMGREFDNISQLKVGDLINALVIEMENEDGYMELSLRQADYEKNWQKITENLENKKIIKSKIIGANKGGLLVELNGMTGFLPVSQLSIKHYPRVEKGDKNKILEKLRQYIGQEFTIKIIDLNQNEEKIIVSEKAAESEQTEKAIANLAIGQIIEGKISGLSNFGAFVKFDDLEGMIHISEMAWQRIDDPHDVVKVGDKVKAKIISLDGNRVSLSLKDLQKDPWQKVSEKFKIGQIIKGKVIQISPFGAFVQLDKNISGLVHKSQLKKKLESGQEYNFEILSIEPEQHRLGLGLVK